MIGYLTGKIIIKKPTQLLIDVNGVGYIVNISISTFEKMPELNESVSLFTHLSVKEDAMDLYGFSTIAEKEMFEVLISVSGIGPKIALSVLSGIPLGELKTAIIEGNISRIVAVPGIGRKTAERMMIELRDKVEKVSAEADAVSGGAATVLKDAIVALTTLGYNQKLAEKTVRDILHSSPSIQIEEVIKESLIILNK